ncbi:MAG: choice-of-anchor D domain-containing protein [Sphingobacteriales bacterium]|nr:MAG: choice-of-anchor D domain-containing protein [Sphingobacteriales bacterium]
MKSFAPLLRWTLSLAIVCLGSVANAADYYWKGGTGQWTDLTHWATTSGGSVSPTIVPTPLDNVIFDGNSFPSNGGTVTISFQSFCNNFTVTSGVGSGVTFNFNNGLLISGALSSAPTGTLTWNQTTLLQVANGISLSKVNYNMAASNSNVTVAAGNLTLSNGAHWNYTSNATVALSGAGATIVMDGTARYTQNNGTLNIGGSMTVPSGATFNSQCSKNFVGNFVMQAGALGTIGGTWNIQNGSFKLDPAANITIGGMAVYLNTTAANNYEIETGGRDVKRIELNGTNFNAEYKLVDNFNATGDGLFIYANKFKSNGKDIRCARFYSWTSGVLSIDLTGTDTVFADYEFRIYPSTNTTFIGSPVIKMTSANHMTFIPGSKIMGDVIINNTNTGDAQIHLQYMATVRDMIINGNGRQYLRMYDNGTYRNFIFNHTNTAVNSTGAQTMDVYGNNTITGSFIYNAASANMKPTWNFQGSNTINVLNWNNDISYWRLGGNTTQTITDLKPMTGTCARPIFIQSMNTGIQGRISQATGSVVADWVLLQDSRAMGGAAFTATNAIDLGNNTGWTITPISAQTFYWIGGTGNWNDPAHWSLSSGGAAGCAVPTRIDSVVFDTASFTATNQFCTINQNAECKNMIWRNIKTGAGINGSSQIDIYGSLELSATMNYNHGGYILFQSTTAGNTIRTNGKTVTSYFQFQCLNSNNGEYTLLDKLTSTNWVLINYGKFYSGGNDIDVHSFYANDYFNRVDFTGTSLIRVNNYFRMWTNTTLVLPITTEIRFDGVNHFYFQSNASSYATRKTYGLVTMTNPNTAGYELLMQGNFNSVHKLRINYHGNNRIHFEQNYSTYDSIIANYTHPNYNTDLHFNIYGQYDTVNAVVVRSTGSARPRVFIPYWMKINNLYIQNASEWTVWPNTNQVSTYGNITLLGTCSPKMLVRNTTAGSNQAIINCTGTATADNCLMKDIKIQGGGTYTSNNSVNAGNVTGWTVGNGTNYYWIGGTGNWNDGNKWALNSGGTASGCIPTQADNVFFDVNSFTAQNQTVNVNVAAQFKNMVWNNVNKPILGGGSTLECFGSLTLAPNVAWNNSNWLYFQSRSTGNTVKASGVTLGNVIFNGEGTYTGGWSLQDSIKVTNDLVFRTGSFSSNGYNLAGRSIYNDNNSALNNIDFTGTTNINVNSQFRMEPSTVFNIGDAAIRYTFSNSNFVFNGGNRTYKDVYFNTGTGTPIIDMNGNNTVNNVYITASTWPTINLNNNATYNDISMVFTNATTNIPQVKLAGTNNINTLSITSTGNGGPYITLQENNTFNSLVASGLGTRLYLGSARTQTVNNVLALGNGSFPVMVQATTAGTQATIYKPSGLVCLDYVLMKDIKGNGLSNGAGGIQTQYFAGASSVNLGNNTNWTFSSCNAYYWVGDGGNWSDVGHWATSSGGTTLHSAPPSASDNVFFDANSFTQSGQTVTINVANAACKNMKWASASFNPTLAGNTNIDIYGDLDLITAMNQSFTGNWNFEADDDDNTLNSAGKSMTNVNFIGGNSGQGKWTLQNPLVVSNDLNLDNGTLASNNKNITTKNFNSTTSNTRSLQLGSSTVTINNGSWNPSTLNNATLVEGTSTIVVTGNTSASFLGNGLTYNNVTFTANPALSASITGSNTVSNTLTISAGMDLSVASSSVQTMGNLVANASCGSPISLHASTGGTFATFSKSSGVVNVKFLNIQDMKAQGGATYNANFSSNLGGNTGWNFTSAPNIDATVSSTFVNCSSNNNGTATVDTVLGGITPYTYLWSTSETSRSISSLIPGTYTVKVTDSSGCSVTKNINVVNNPATITAVPFSTSASNVCQGTAISFTAGTPAQAVSGYSWNFGDFSASTAQNFTKTYGAAGTYNVSLSYIDANGCPAIATSVVRVSSVSRTINSTNISCNGAANGTITVNATGGIPPYQYSIDNGASYVSSGSFTSLTPGTYTVRVKDSINCSAAAQNVTISQPAQQLSFSASVTGVTCAGTANGGILVSAAGGTVPYNYSINNGILYLTSNNFQNLTTGNYNVIVRDANGCVAATQAKTISVSDNVKPTITCPGNISTGSTGCTQFVTVPAPATGDNCGVASVTNSYNNTANASDEYPVGITQVIWTVVDVNNNVERCTMTVTITGPEINITGNNNTIVDGDNTPATSDNTDFGSVTTGGTVTKSFVIKNAGTTNLVINSVGITGVNASSFAIPSATYPVTITPGNVYTVNASFMPVTLGSYSAVLNVNNTDCDESAYEFAIAGTGICPQLTASVTGTTAVCPGANAAINFGGQANNVVTYAVNGGANQTITLNGAGSASLTVTPAATSTYAIVSVSDGTCSNGISGQSATVIINQLPVAYTVTGGGSYCNGGTGVAIGLSNSQSGVSYQLVNGTTNVGSPVSGNGLAISFGNQMAAGTYSVVATNNSTSCVNNMSNTTAVSINNLPAVYNVSGGGSYCSGGTGVAIGLSGSETGVNYQLKNGNTNVGSAVAGTGSAISFGSMTTAGAYTVVATNAITSCVSNMGGNAAVVINPLPTVLTSATNPVNAGFTLTLTASGASTYAWSGPGGFTATGSPATRTSMQLADAGVYTVTGTDANGCSNTASVSVTVNPPATALSFGNGNDYIVSANNIDITGNQPRTIEYWGRLNGGYQHQVNWGTTGQDNRAFGTFTVDNVLLFYGWSSGDFVVSNFTPDNNLHHIAVSYDGTDVRFYVDGVLKNQVARSLNTGNGKVYIGVREDVANNVANYSGSLDEVRIWNRVLCTEEIQLHKNCELNGNENGLVLHYKLNHGFVNANNAGVITAVDNSPSGNNGTLVNFSLTGTSSNWIANGGASGSCAPYTVADINLKGNGNTILNNTTALSTANNTDMGTTAVGTPVTKQFTVENTGSAPLVVSGISFTGTGAAMFSTSGISFPATVAAGGKATFNVVFNGTGVATYNATVNIASNDCDENPYKYAVKGVTTCSMPAFTSCPSNQTAIAPFDACGNIVNYSTSVSGVPTPALSYTFTGATTGSGSGNGSGAMFNKGVTNVTVTASNACGNKTCTFTVTVSDVTAPSMVTPAAATVSCQDATTTAALGTATATDNCSGTVAIGYSDASTQNADVNNAAHYNYTITRTWTATDASNNTTTTTQTITVQDVTDPVLSVPAATTVSCHASTATSATGTATATDNCSPVTVTYADASTQNANAANAGHYNYTITRTWTATDVTGNTVSGTQLITVEDVTDPTIAAPASVTVSCDASTATSATGTATGNDNCSPVNVTYTDASTQDADANNAAHYNYSITRTWTVTDASGNDVSATQVITVQDVADPSISTPAGVTVSCSGSTATTATGVATGNDNCSPVAVTYGDVSTQNTDANNAGHYNYTITRTWTVTDVSGNDVSGTQIITVEDVTDPSIAAPANVTVNCQDATTVAAVGTATGADNCSPVAITYSDASTQNASSTSSAHYNYTITRTWTATDVSGNDVSAVQTITVQDVTAPAISCPANATVSCDASTATSATGTATGNDNCSAVAISYTDVSTQNANTNNAGYYNYTITRTWKAEDASGNFSTCNQVITVQDVANPTISCPASVTVNCQDAKTPTALGTATGSDNCSPVSITYSDVSTQNASNATAGHYNYTITRTWKAMDVTGNFTTCNQVITVQDVTAPVVTCPANITTSCKTATSFTGSATASDNCSPVTITYTDASTQSSNTASAAYYSYAITRTWKAQDVSGNFSTCNQVITVKAFNNAAIAVTPVNTINANHANYTIYRGYGPQTVTLAATVSGGVGTLSYSWTPSATVANPASATTSVSPTTTTTYTVTITDATGCTITKSMTIYVIDVRCDKKVKICHIPPGNTGNPQQLCLPESAIAAHLAHGCRLGDCSQSKEEPVAEDGDVPMNPPVMNEVKVYPNPNTGVFVIDMPVGTKNASVLIMDMAGKVIERRVTANTERMQFDLSNIAKGCYMIQVSGDRTYRSKIVIQ